MPLKIDQKVISGSEGKLITMDIHYKEHNKNMPIVIFAHGYKGFKDFGAWSHIADQFASQGKVFVRFNFSHNGVSSDNLLEFGDLTAFGENNYSKEIFDFNTVIDFIYELAKKEENWDQENISIIGHSRGGGMAILTACKNNLVKKLITWASINSTYRGMPSGTALDEWKKEGVRYVLNGRTKQNMPHFIQFYNDLESNKGSLNIEKCAKRLSIPWLIIHGDSDEAVPLSEAIQLNEWNNEAILNTIENGSHTFGISHPWQNEKLSNEMQEVVDLSIGFI